MIDSKIKRVFTLCVVATTLLLDHAAFAADLSSYAGFSGGSGSSGGGAASGGANSLSQYAPSSDTMQNAAKKLLSGSDQKDVQVQEYRAYGLKNHFYIGLQGGIASYATPADTTNFVVPNAANITFDNTALKNSFLFGLNAGYQVATSNTFFVPAFRFGLQADYFSPATLNGNIKADDTDSPFYNGPYSSSLSSMALFITGEMDIFKWGSFRPYIHLGVGGARNSMANYNESHFAFDVNGQSSMGLAYQAGVGADYYFTQHFSLGLAYIYNYLGSMQAQVIDVGGGTGSEIGSLNYKITDSQYLLTMKYLV